MSQTPGPDEVDPGKQYLVPPELAVHLDISEDLLMDFGVIPDTRPPLPPPPPRWRRWWEWPPVQSWWYRQYKRADRRAFRRECAEIRWREVWKDRRGC